MPQELKREQQRTSADVAQHEVPAATKGAANAKAGDAAVSRMAAHEDVGSMSLGDRLWKAALHCGHAFEEEALKSIVSALEIAVPVWIVSHAFGLGEVIDVIGVLLAANDTATAVEEIIVYFKAARDAKAEADLEKAGDHLGKAIALVGTGFFIGKLAKLGMRGAGEHIHGTSSEGRVAEAAESAHAPHAEPAAVHAEHAPAEHATHAEAKPAAHAEAKPAEHVDPAKRPKVEHHEEHAAEKAHWKPDTRNVIVELQNRGAIVEHLERAHKVGGAPDAVTGGEGEHGAKPAKMDWTGDGPVPNSPLDGLPSDRQYSA